MKNSILFIAGFPALLLAVAAQAGSMTCGDVTISGDQDTGQSTDQILQQCGPPTSQDGNNWTARASWIPFSSRWIRDSNSGGAPPKGGLPPWPLFPLTAKLNKPTVVVDRPQLSRADIKEFESAMMKVEAGRK